MSDDRDLFDDYEEGELSNTGYEDQAGEYVDETQDYEAEVQTASITPQQAEPTTLDETERLRQPRAQNFRRRLGNQISMLPLALFVLAAGGLMIANAQDVEGVPTFSSGALAGGFILVLAFTAIFRAVLAGRRERGLLFLGLWIWSIAAVLAGIIYGVDENPDAVEWWPLLILALAPAFLLTYLIERVHDARLILLSILSIVAAGTALGFTTGQFDEQFLNEAADYWPLLLSVVGIGLLPLVFRRRTG